MLDARASSSLRRAIAHGWARRKEARAIRVGTRIGPTLAVLGVLVASGARGGRLLRLEEVARAAAHARRGARASARAQALGGTTRISSTPSASSSGARSRSARPEQAPRSCSSSTRSARSRTARSSPAICAPRSSAPDAGTSTRPASRRRWPCSPRARVTMDDARADVDRSARVRRRGPRSSTWRAASSSASVSRGRSSTSRPRSRSARTSPRRRWPSPRRRPTRAAGRRSAASTPCSRDDQHLRAQLWKTFLGADEMDPDEGLRGVTALARRLERRARRPTRARRAVARAAAPPQR